VRVWNAVTGAEIGSWEAPQSPLSALTASPDGKTLAAVGGKALIHLWEVPGGKEVRRLIVASTIGA